MTKKPIAGFGRRRPQLNLRVQKLHLDPDNPRLPEECQGKSESEVLKFLYRDFNLDELALSMAQNGYFDEEPLVAFPRGLPPRLRECIGTPEDPNYKAFMQFIESVDTEFTVVEGNRRLATCKLLLGEDLRKTLGIRHWPKLNAEVADDLAELPVIVYASRDAVIPYLGVRHIVGIQKWDAYAKARYIAAMVEEGSELAKVEEQIGDKRGAARKSYVAYRLLRQAEDELDLDIKGAKTDFSLLILAIGQSPVKKFLGLPAKLAEVNLKEPVQESCLKSLKHLMLWIYGDKGVRPAISESRDITRWLSAVLASEVATAHLIRTARLEDAYELSDGEEAMVIRDISKANSKLQRALGVAHRHKTVDVIAEAEKCAETAKRLLETVKDEAC